VQERLAGVNILRGYKPLPQVLVTAMAR